MLGNVLQVVGAVSISAGVFLIWYPAGFIVAGILSILLGVGWVRKSR